MIKTVMGKHIVLTYYYGGVKDDFVYMPLPGNFLCVDLGRWDYSSILFEEFYFYTFKSNSDNSLKLLTEGKEFSVDVKYEESIKAKFDSPIIYVSNEHPYGDGSLKRRL
jgi:hypothetical protein